MKAARSITDRAKRYRANSAAKKIEWGRPRRCHYCGRTGLKVDIEHIDGSEENGAPRNLTLACRTCNTLKGVTFKKAGIGKATAQYNPAVSKKQYRLALAVMEGHSTKMPVKVAREMVEQTPHPGELPNPAGARSWQEYVAAVLTLTGQGRAAHIPAARDMLQATPHAKRTAFAKMMQQPVKANPGARTSFEYFQAVAMHTRKAHDEGGRIIHDTPKSRRRRFASEFWEKRRAHGTTGRKETVPF